MASLLLICLAVPVHAEVVLSEGPGHRIAFEGLLQTDGYWYDSDLLDLDADGGDGNDSDFGLRRAELVLEGQTGDLDWVLGYDASGDGKFLDVNLEYGFGADERHSVRAGQYKQPNSLEELSSTKNNDFIAKALVTNTFAVSRRLGIGYGYGGDDLGVDVSVFGRELTRDRARGSGFGARSYWAPVNSAGSILHLGLSHVDYDTDAGALRYRVRPGADFANRLIDTGTLTDAERVSTTGLESFWVRGPLKLQGEYMTSTVQRDGAGSGDFTASGGYLSGVWNLTGETWSYKAGTPATPRAQDSGAGLWQLGLRHDVMDLDDSGVAGGRLKTWTAGVNWYWRSNFKFVLNYVKVDSQRSGIEDDPEIVEARAQFHW